MKETQSPAIETTPRPGSSSSLKCRFAPIARIARRVACLGTGWSVDRFSPDAPHILVACQPKSGSTFFSRCMAALPGMRLVQLTAGYGRREQELCELRLRRYRRRAYVAQHHVRCSEVTDEFVERFGLTVVVLVRDLFDVTVSLRDHLRRESVSAPMAYFEEEHRRLPDAELEAMIAQLAIPWYVNFYMSWRKSPYARIVRYEELIEDPAAAVRLTAKRAGCSASEADIRRAIATVRDARFNVGSIGRGRVLDCEVKKAIVNMLERYPAARRDGYVQRMVNATD